MSEEKHIQKSPTLKNRSEYLRLLELEKIKKENEDIGNRILTKYYLNINYKLIYSLSS
jgi:hypothetical protein